MEMAKPTRLTDAIVKRLPDARQGQRDHQGHGGHAASALASPPPASRAFVLDYLQRGRGRERRYTIGGWPDWTADSRPH